MPEIQAEGIDVSAEEERYLRSAFRRFALPYLAATLAMVGVAVAAVSLSASEPAEGRTEELQSLVAEAASLREAIAGLKVELHEYASESGARLDRLESGFAQLGSEDPAQAELAGRLDHAHQRIGALEGRLEQLGTARVSPPPEPPSWPPASPSLP